MKKKYIITGFLFFAAFIVHGQSTKDLKLTLIGDSVISKERKMQIKISIENRKKQTTELFTEYISMIIYNDRDTALSGCLVDEKGDKIFLEVRRKNIKTRLKPSKVFTTEQRVIDFNTLCWNGNSENMGKFYIKASYYDVKSKRLYYSEPKLLIKAR